MEDVLLVAMGAALGSYSASATSMLVYQTGVSETNRLLRWSQLGGEGGETVGDSGQLFHPKVSPDGTRAMVEVRGEGEEGVDLWLVDLTTGLRTRFTFDEGDEIAPCWTPDGGSVIYTTAIPNEAIRIVRQPIEGVGGGTVLYESSTGLRTHSVSPDGTSLFFDREGEASDVDIMQLPLTKDAEPTVWLATPETEGGARYSPDGRWVAYHAASTAGWDVFVRPAAGGARKWQVTTDGAVYPQWKTDGTELLVSKFNGAVTAYKVDIQSGSFHVGSSKPVAITEGPSGNGVAYSVAPDGQRILTAGPDPTSQAEVSLVHLVTDWRRGLAQ